MAKMRIYELAKELNVENAELLGFLGLDGKTASSSLEDAEVERARQHFAPKAAKAPAKTETLQTSRFAGQSIFKDQAKSQEAPSEEKAPASPRPEGSAAGNAPRPVKKPAPQGAPAQKSTTKKPMFKMIGAQKAGSAPAAVSSSAYTDKNAKRPVRPERPAAASSNEPHRPIKPNVQTTAEQYQRYQGSEIRKYDAEKAAREEAERAQQEKAEREARIRAEREAALKAEKEARERAEQEARERAEAERAAAEKAAAEKAAKEAAEKAAAEKAAAEKAAREAAEAAEKAAAEKAAAEKAAREAEEAKEREALEKAAREKEEAAKKAAAEKAAAEKAALEKAAAEKAAKEAAERAAKEKAAAEKAAKEKANAEHARASQNRPGQQNASGKPGQRPDNKKGGKFVRPDGQNAQKPQNDGQKKPADSGFWKTPSGEKTPGPVKRTLHTLDSLEPAKKVSVLGKVDLNAVKKQEEKAQSAGKKGIFANRSGRVYFVDNAQGGQGAGRPQSGRPGSRDGGFRPNNNMAGAFNKDGDAPQQGRRPQGAGQRRPAQGAPGAASQGAAFGKPDQRGRKGANNKRDGRDFQNFDRGGKRAENFHNLSKDQNKKNVREVEVEEQIKQITLPDSITVRELADKMKIKATEIVKKLFLAGKMISVNDEISYEEAENIAIEYDILCEHEEQVDVIGELLKEAEEDEKDLEKRPPVVCVMGHVDHGKTSLLDAIRHTNVISREAGGITQHIGAYMVEINGEKITFLDTPGHEAFTAMRMRGAQATDIAILVVAADDGVMPQTVEAINHAKAANVDIIVAVNKIDKPAANVDRVKQELSEYGLIPEDWGGSTVFVPVSAKKNENIDQLLEMILLVTEVKELKANPNRELRGLVIEAKLDKGRGPVATVLVQKGTLKQGDFISAGACFGRVRAMLDADGNEVKKATPSTPVEVLGLNGVPMAGEVAVGHKNEREARSFAETFIAEERKKMLAETKHKLTMDSLFEQIREGELKELPLVVKADVQGSVEALCSSLEKLSNDEVTVRVIHAGVGAITESDVTLAAASNAIVIGFNTKPDQQGRMIAEQEKVDVRLYRVIYQAIDDVQAALQGMLAPVYEEKILGHAEIRAIFKASGIGSIAGSYVLDGTIERGSKARITRGKDQIFDGAIASLKRFKDDVKEVREGFECGIVFEKFNDLLEGDQVEVYKMVRVEQK